MKAMLTQIGKNFLNLFYPHLCIACQDEISSNEDILCLTCSLKLPKTNFHLYKENPFTDRFWGRLSLENGAALYHFVKGGKTQHLIHNLKYKGRKDIGSKLGKWYGRQLKKSAYFNDIQLIIPVPLHPRKERKRGYNQSYHFAKGLSESMNIRIDTTTLVRKEFTISQTEKSRIERFENVIKAFEVRYPDQLKNKHILLVDDVITTGATLEACGIKLLKIEGVQLSMATIAIANT
ncbi:MAG: ComF family protein [Saprospiraceae bacterium]|jgi:ComF family protein|nr:ComF family protein [Saprospiraceae bacterium]